jgi:hypothetical protein
LEILNKELGSYSKQGLKNLKALLAKAAKQGGVLNLYIQGSSREFKEVFL